MAAGEPQRTRGEIITFYSYKGGTGRTMALANVACLLAERIPPDEKLLVIDWDLEAPGLHRFFPGRLNQPLSTMGLGLDAGVGLIDLFTKLGSALPSKPAESEEAADAALATAFAKLRFDEFFGESGIPRAHILRAGRNDDGQYSRRVNTFNWEDLFRRVPNVYRRFAERLAEQFRFVLIDSRTGVTDISGICTSLLPEKLVVVFTPNRQSLTGVRELIGNATSYRRGSDDLRPLLVYPLPSRIEASLQDLRAYWRFGNRDLDIVGYQPMFEAALAEAYGLQRCDMSAYFDEVQIQQTPDYAYGEEIAVRRTSDRFSLGNSYRVFVDRLVSGAPPWAEAVVAPARDAEAPPPAPPVRPAPEHVVPPAAAAASTVTAGPPSAPPAPSSASNTKIFLSYATEDRERARSIAERFRAQGWDVWFDVTVKPGLEFSRAIAEALDLSDVIVVCWSKASTVSQSVMTEAYEGARRGVLIPVLLDDAVPPLAFRHIQSADLRRDDPRSLEKLVNAVNLVAQGQPGSPAAAAQISVPDTSVPTLAPRIWHVAIGAVAALFLVMLAVGSYRFLGTSSMDRPTSTTIVSSTAPPRITMPNFVGAQTSDVKKTADLLKLAVVMRDERGSQSSYFEGVVTSQTPAAGDVVSPGTQIQLSVSTLTVQVPTVVRDTLDTALRRLQESELRLGTTQSRYAGDVKPGTIISQSPQSGVKVPVGSAIDIVVAETAPVRVGGSIRSPTKTKDVPPVYPVIAQSARVQGIVTLEVTIGPRGNVVEARILRSIPLLDQAAIDAVRQWEYTPTVLGRVPVPVVLTVTVPFMLP